MLASRSGRSAIVELLVDNGADLMATNKVLKRCSMLCYYA
jgi:hypothetical protein